MTKFDYAMYAVGVASLVGAGGLSAWIILKEMIPNRHRIMAAYRGEALFPPPVMRTEVQMPEPPPVPALMLTSEVA